MEFHEVSNIFPLEKGTLNSLAKSIKENGLRLPISVMDGKIIDGRRRWLACEKLGIEPDIEHVNWEDPVEHVVDLNIHRRHLNTNQKGMASNKARVLKKKYEQEAKENQKEGGKEGGKIGGRGMEKIGLATGGTKPIRKPRSSDKRGEQFGTSGRSVERADKIAEEGTKELIEAVENDEVSLTKGEEIARLPKLEQNKKLKSVVEDKKSNRNGKTQRQIAAEKKAAKIADPKSSALPSKGITLGNRAIDCLKKIPKGDATRNRAFEMVISWAKNNK